MGSRRVLGKSMILLSILISVFAIPLEFYSRISPRCVEFCLELCIELAVEASIDCCAIIVSLSMRWSRIWWMLDCCISLREYIMKVSWLRITHLPSLVIVTRRGEDVESDKSIIDLWQCMIRWIYLCTKCIIDAACHQHSIDTIPCLNVVPSIGSL